MVKGTINYPATLTLPASAVLTVKLMWGTRDFLLHVGNLVEPVVEQRISPVGTGPVPFALVYDPAVIDPGLPYTILVELSADGKPLAIGGIGVITWGQPSDVAVTLWSLPNTTALTGTVRYGSNRPIPPGSVLTIVLEKRLNGFTEDPASPVVSVQHVRPVDASPIPFTIPFDPSTLDPYATYHVFATLQEPSGVSWRTQFQNILAWDDPTREDLTLRPPVKTALLTGKITLPDSSALPPDAVVSAQIVQVHKDRIELPNYQHRITQAGASPIPYAIEYMLDPWSPVKQALYASVQLDGKLLYTSPLIPLDRAAMPDTLDLSLQRPANLGTVRGTVRYNADQPLPPDAKLVVQLADMWLVDVHGEPQEIATQTIPLTDSQPLSFTIEYDRLRIWGPISHAILAEIRSGDQVLARSSGQDYVNMTDNPTEIDVVLQ